MKTYIAYFRVSTKRQGLGLEAQKAICETFAAQNGANIICEYSEKESGKEYIAHRPELRNALEHCKQSGATLLVAKVDRLSRDLADGAALCKEHSVEFCDHPNMSALEQGIFFGMAMQERQFISQRTSAALQAKKAAGAKLGRPDATWTKEQRSASVEARRNAARNNEFNRRAYALVAATKGLPYSAIASNLNAAGFTTAKGGKWSAVQVQRLEKLMQA